MLTQKIRKSDIILKIFGDNYDTGILSPVSQRTAPHHHHHHHRPAHGSTNAHSALAPPSPHHQRANSSGGTIIDSNDTSTGSIKTCHQEVVLESLNLTICVGKKFKLVFISDFSEHHYVAGCCICAACVQFQFSETYDFHFLLKTSNVIGC